MGVEIGTSAFHSDYVLAQVFDFATEMQFEDSIDKYPHWIFAVKIHPFFLLNEVCVWCEESKPTMPKDEPYLKCGPGSPDS